MMIILVIFLLVSIFEVIHLIKQKNKKEVAVYAVIAAMTVALALYVILVPQHDSFSKIMLRLLKIEGS